MDVEKYGRRKAIKKILAGGVGLFSVSTVLAGEIKLGFLLKDSYAARRTEYVRGIIVYPSDFLREYSEEVGEIDDYIRRIAKELDATLRADISNSSLAAPQIGHLERMIALKEHGGVEIMINPEIISRKGDYRCAEMCASVPSVVGFVHRSREVEVSYRTLDNDKIIRTYKKRNAAVIQHEIDHLDGILFTDKMERN